MTAPFPPRDHKDDPMYAATARVPPFRKPDMAKEKPDYRTPQADPPPEPDPPEE